MKTALEIAALYIAFAFGWAYVQHRVYKELPYWQLLLICLAGMAVLYIIVIVGSLVG